MNMVCNLTDFLQDESVYPALEAMLPQFEARMILFGQRGKWAHRHMGGIDFISTGRAKSGEHLTWGLLEAEDGTVRFQVMEVG
jgi:hypothetical protein